MGNYGQPLFSLGFLNTPQMELASVWGLFGCSNPLRFAQANTLDWKPRGKPWPASCVAFTLIRSTQRSRQRLDGQKPSW